MPLGFCNFKHAQPDSSTAVPKQRPAKVNTAYQAIRECSLQIVGIWFGLLLDSDAGCLSRASLSG